MTDDVTLPDAPSSEELAAARDTLRRQAVAEVRSKLPLRIPIKLAASSAASVAIELRDDSTWEIVDVDE